MFFFFFLLGSFFQNVYSKGDRIPFFSERTDLTDIVLSDVTLSHELIFSIPRKNMNKLEEVLVDISDPSSSHYAKYWTTDDIGEMIRNKESYDIVTEYLVRSNIDIVSVSRYGEYITASAQISTWNSMFDTAFHDMNQVMHDGRLVPLIRAEEYYIPSILHDHLDYVLNIVELPIPFLDSIDSKAILPYSPNYITPRDLRKYYNLDPAIRGNQFSTQAIIGLNGNTVLSPTDLKIFQSLDKIYINQTVLPNPYNRVVDNYPNGNYGEVNLDTQYIMSMSPGSPTSFQWLPDGLFAGMRMLNDMNDPPKVISISYGLAERYISMSDMDLFNIEAIKLCMKGVTIVSSAGNSGSIITNVPLCQYDSIFPASSPYVVAVGATSGVENGEKEVVCSYNTTSRITSGGGFSSYYSQPLYQTKHVNDYFVKANIINRNPFPGYNRAGRAYPDISMAGLQYLVIVNKNYVAMSGTSASAPVAAGFFSNINAARMALGKGSVGWINPALYKYAESFVNDITEGNNISPGITLNCPHGFHTTTGWDPASGLGSMDYKKLQDVFVSLGKANEMTNYPTITPTVSPTRLKFHPARQPTFVPTKKPTFTPTQKPTFIPTQNPTFTPTQNPTFTPTHIPTFLSTPTQKPTFLSTQKPTFIPTQKPTFIPTQKPTFTPTQKQIGRAHV